MMGIDPPARWRNSKLIRKGHCTEPSRSSFSTEKGNYSSNSGLATNTTPGASGRILVAVTLIQVKAWKKVLPAVYGKKWGWKLP
jgi:hypothetical protein